MYKQIEHKSPIKNINEYIESYLKKKNNLQIAHNIKLGEINIVCKIIKENYTICDCNR